MGQELGDLRAIVWLVDGTFSASKTVSVVDREWTAASVAVRALAVAGGVDAFAGLRRVAIEDVDIAGPASNGWDIFCAMAAAGAPMDTSIC